LVIALGQDDSSAVYDDVWAFDPAPGTWSRLSAGTGPAARYGACGVVDADGRLLITHGFSTEQRFDDTWAFDLAAGSWAETTPGDGPRPVRRCLHACALDPASGALVMFGGRTDDDPYLADTWRLEADGWQELAETGPSDRARSRAATVAGGIHVIGGEGPDGLPADAWRLDVDGWELGPTGAPAARQAHAVAQGDGEVWVFGGRDAQGSELGDLWRLG
jgi:N-acetylneuraminic acid mutarotase